MKVSFLIIALLVLYIIGKLFYKFFKGDFYYSKYPIAKEMDEILRRGEKIPANIDELMVKEIDLNEHKAVQLYQFKQLIKRLNTKQV